MCLILLAYRPDDCSQVLLAANRDEFYARPTAAASFWEDHPQVLAGRDLEMGGTWLGVTREGRFAAVTNFRESLEGSVPPRSRGELTTGFLLGSESPRAYLERISVQASQYRGFNLLVGDRDGLYYFSNRAPGVRELSPGIYAVSNQLLNCDWPKVVNGRRQLGEVLARPDSEGGRAEMLFSLLADRGSDAKAWSAKFIVSPTYGTRSSTLVHIGALGHVAFRERSFGQDGGMTDDRPFSFQTQSRSC